MSSMFFVWRGIVYAFGDSGSYMLEGGQGDSPSWWTWHALTAEQIAAIEQGRKEEQDDLMHTNRGLRFALDHERATANEKYGAGYNDGLRDAKKIMSARALAGEREPESGG